MAQGYLTGLIWAAALLLVGCAAASEPKPASGGKNWQLVFADEFDGPALDSSSWTTCYWWNKDGCTNLANQELQWYLPENTMLEDGVLKLTARREAVTGWEGKSFPFTSGMVTSGRDYEELPRRPRHEFQYGYFEIRAKVPRGKGLWPAFWLLPSSRESKPEIDVMEVLGHRTKVLEIHFHYKDANGKTRSVGTEVANADLAADWHVYGCDWRAGEIVWYLDGREVWRFSQTEHVPQEPMYLILNMAVGGKWPGNPDTNTAFPATFAIDYVRVWRDGKL